MFSIVQSISSPASVCTQEIFEATLDNPRVAELNRAAMAETNSDRRAQIKKQLPAFCFHATFSDGKRHNQSAVASGLYIIDLDHVKAAMPLREYYQNLIGGREQALGIVLAHITPSGEGLRLVGICPEGKDIVESQQWMITQLGITEYDGVVKDLARLSFAPCRDQLIYYNPEGLFAERNTTVVFGPQLPPPAPSIISEDEPASSLKKDGVFAATYKGVEYKMIVERLLLAIGVSDEPVQGERNTTLYTLVRHLRYICDFNADLLQQIIPSWGLTPAEVQATIKSALGSVRSSDIPQTVRRIVEQLQRGQGLDFEQQAAAQSFQFDPNRLPRLPRLLQLLVKAYPGDYRPAVLMSVLPLLGTLATHVRGYYLDGQLHSLSFITSVVAPQASGKSFTRRLFDMLMGPIEAQDAVGREQERKYNEEKKATKNKAKQPEDPRAVIRIIPATVSNAMLLKRADYAQGQHLITYAEEIDTLVRGNKAGSWSAKSDTLRQAFDNAKWGQDYMSENSYSGQVNLYYNLLMCGTPRAINRFFNDVEDGLVSRVIFAQLPDMLGSAMPVFGHLTKREMEEVKAEAQRLFDLHSTSVDGPEVLVENPRLLKAIGGWLEERRMEYLRDQDHPSLDIFRRRSAVIGFRAGLLCTQLCEQSKMACDFALWVANYTLYQQLRLFGEEMDRVLAESQQISEKYEAQRQGHNVQLIDQLPTEFSLQDLIQARMHQGLTTEPNTLRSVICRWIKNGMLCKVGDNLWRKPEAA